MAADIYSWGILGIKIIKDKHEFLRDRNGELIYPAAMMRVLEQCIDPDPAGRLSAGPLVFAMDEVLDGPSGLAAGDETEWYDSSYDLPEARKVSGPRADGDLGSSWLKSVPSSGWT
jgi:hypothetical protein